MAPNEPKTGKPAPGSGQNIFRGNNFGLINTGIIGGNATNDTIVYEQSPPRTEAALPSEAAVSKVMRILFLGANPEGAPSLRLDHEVREISLALRQADFRDRFDLRQQNALRVTDLQNALLHHQPQIVHFSGHGAADGLYLEDEAGMARKVEGSVIARILALFKEQLRCVLLNACYSREQAEAIAKDIDCVVGMSTAIGDLAAVRFSTAFYGALASGSSVAKAFDLGCLQIDLDGLGEGNTPQLIAFRQKPEEVVFVKEDLR